MIADLVLLDANPLEDIANTQKRAGAGIIVLWFTRPSKCTGRIIPADGSEQGVKFPVKC